MEKTDWVRLVGPLVTGGLAGAVLTAFIASWRASQTQQRVYWSLSTFDISAAGDSDLPKSLRVSYDGKDYPHLSLVSLDAGNDGQVPVDGVSLVLRPDGPIIEQTATHRPLGTQIRVDDTDLEPGLTRFVLPPMAPGDRVKIRVLVGGQCDAECFPRGPATVQFEDGPQRTRRIERRRRLRSGVAFLATIPASLLVWPLLQGQGSTVSISGFLCLVVALGIMSSAIESTLKDWLPDPR
jgi:hypothetical protein